MYQKKNELIEKQFLYLNFYIIFITMQHICFIKRYSKA